MATSNYIKLKLKNRIKIEHLRNLVGSGDRFQQGRLHEQVQGLRPEAPTLGLILGCRCLEIRDHCGPMGLTFMALDQVRDFGCHT